MVAAKIYEQIISKKQKCLHSYSNSHLNHTYLVMP